jgi:hypothetical protein
LRQKRSRDLPKKAIAEAIVLSLLVVLLSGAGTDVSAEVNDKDNDGWVPLMSAVRYDANPEIAVALIERGADIGARDKYGLTALDHANEKKL